MDTQNKRYPMQRNIFEKEVSNVNRKSLGVAHLQETSPAKKPVEEFIGEEGNESLAHVRQTPPGPSVQRAAALRLVR